MHRPSLLVLHAPECSGEAHRIARAIRRQWPRPGEEPDIETAFIGGPRDDAALPAVYVLGPDGATPHESDLNRAWSARRAAIVLCPRVGGPERALRGYGMLVEALDFPPAMLAGALYAMLARQSVIAELHEELHVTTVSTGGVAGEIERFQDEMHLAASVQRELLPRRLPKTDTFETGVIFRPAGFVSGDIYDAEMIDDRWIAFFVADAIGHGVPAALMTMAISHGLRRLERRAGQGRMTPPSDVLRALNTELVRKQDDPQRFATAVYGVLDTHTSELTLASAGHPAPLLLSRSASGPGVESLDAGGPLLGIFDDAEFDQCTRTMEPGQTLLIYSDGFETVFPQPADQRHTRRAGEAHLKHLAGVASFESESLGDSLARLEALLDLQSGSLHQADDITALAIAMGGVGASVPKAALKAA
ncbi:MAG: SpoIIE family protein phosphatase [Phycisphaerales bacterium]|nr:SpoIIE family protein phosphatase [Phycisphaerales bacterium]